MTIIENAQLSLVFSIIFTQNKTKKRGGMITREHSTWGKHVMQKINTTSPRLASLT
jgi:hypothetical protein